MCEVKGSDIYCLGERIGTIEYGPEYGADLEQLWANYHDAFENFYQQRDVTYRAEAARKRLDAAFEAYDTMNVLSMAKITLDSYCVVEMVRNVDTFLERNHRSRMLEAVKRERVPFDTEAEYEEANPRHEEVVWNARIQDWQ